jgi:hypothetical protein
MDNEGGYAGLGESNFLQFEPSALLELNLQKICTLRTWCGIPFVGQMEYRNFSQSDISGLTGYAWLKYGLFK